MNTTVTNYYVQHPVQPPLFCWEILGQFVPFLKKKVTLRVCRIRLWKLVEITLICWSRSVLNRFVKIIFDHHQRCECMRVTRETWSTLPSLLFFECVDLRHIAIKFYAVYQPSLMLKLQNWFRFSVWIHFRAKWKSQNNFK